MGHKRHGKNGLVVCTRKCESSLEEQYCHEAVADIWKSRKAYLAKWLDEPSSSKIIYLTLHPAT